MGNALQKFLDDWNARYDEDVCMAHEVFHSVGYHSRVASGTIVHPTRENLNYAVLLLRTGGSRLIERGEKIIQAVLKTQDPNPTSKTYGIFPWLLEEPLDAMSPPDWNWADFCGAALAHVLIEHDRKIGQDLSDAIRTGLGHAAWSIFRRNVGPDYTNITVMGSGITLIAGELLGEARLVTYGRQRLHNFLEYTRFQGDFNEYNSPTYAVVALNECERILQLARDPEIRADAESIRRLIWKGIAEHFHPATAQWAGPHSRAYTDRLNGSTVHYISSQTGVSIQPHPTTEGGEYLNIVQPLPCPEEWIGRFRALPEDEVVLERTFSRSPDGTPLVTGNTWLSHDICLGSTSRDSLWTQRRPLIAYWKTAEDPAVVLRQRFLKDERDFASVGAINRQWKNRVLSSFEPLDRMGDYHLYLDHPEDGIFTASDFRLRYELRGSGVRADQVDETRYALEAGNIRAVLHTAPGWFNGEKVLWQLGSEDDLVYLDAVCYQGKASAFHLMSLERMILAIGLEILPFVEQPTGEPVSISTGADDKLHCSWRDLSLLI